MKRSIITIALAFVATALVVTAGMSFATAAGGSGGGNGPDTKVLGGGADKEEKPLCGSGRDDECTAIGTGTVFMKQLGDKKNPFVAPSNGRIVAWAIELGKKPSNKPPKDDPDTPEDESQKKPNLEFFQDLFGSEKFGEGPVGRLAILRRQGGGVEYKLVDQSPLVKLGGNFYNEDTVITLERPLLIKEGDVVGLTSLTWIPTIAKGAGKSSYRLSIPREKGVPPEEACDTNAQIEAKAQKKVGSTREYGCIYDARRIFYRAFFVAN